MQAIQTITNALLTLMLWATALNLGMQFTIPQIMAPLQRPGMILMMVVVNMIAVPLIAWGLTSLFPMNSSYATGILLTTFSMAAPLGLKYVQGAKGDMPYAIALVVLLQVLNVISIPLWAAWLLPGGVTINPLQVMGTLVFNVLLPLGIGLFIKARYPEYAADWYPMLGKVSTWALIGAVVLTLLTDLPTLISLIGSFALLVSVLICVIAGALGYFLGGRREVDKRTGAIISSARAAGPAMLIASQAFPTQPQVLAGAVAIAVVVTILPMIAMMEWGKHDPHRYREVSGRARAGV